MALKVLTPIGTDGGITEELYVRISNYQISKYGSATFNLQLFLNEKDSKQQVGTVRNNQIGDVLTLLLQKILEDGSVIADLSPLVGVDIFTFAYGELKKKLEGLFPDIEIVDC